MALRKDDPVYYKNKLTDLLNQAKDNGLIIKESYGIVTFRSETEIPLFKVPNIEQASIDIKEFVNKNMI